MTDESSTTPGDFECVEPDLGRQLWRRPEPDLDPELKQLLEDHLSICDACRVTVMVEDRIAGALQLGDLHLDRRPVRRSPRINQLMAAAGGLATAASLVLMFSLPPTNRSAAGLVRGPDPSGGFIRPVEGEILTATNPELRWTPIPGATAYLVEVSDVAGGWVWSGRTSQTVVSLPESTSLPRGATFRALVEPVPADLAGVVDVSVYFQRSGLRAFLAYRMASSPRWVQILGGLGMVVSGWAALVWARRFRAPSRRQAA